MKPLLKIFAAIVVLNIGGWLLSANASAQDVSFQVFYDNLSPYGQWVSYPNYGYVWVPNVGPDFTPYGTNGHWVLTDDGWTWVSDYQWGWAPFHYGRWLYDTNYGWLWVPDTVWGPAWVSWRTGGGCYGWTPLGPGFGIGVAFYAPPERWIFCDQAHFCDPYISRYYLPRGNNVTIYRSTTIINNTYVDNNRHVTYATGPRRADVERVTHTTVAPVAIRENSRPGSSVSGGALNIYRPAVQKTTAGGARPVPTHVAALKDVKPVAQRTTSTKPARQTTSTNSQHSSGTLPNSVRPQRSASTNTNTGTASHTNVPISRPSTQAAKTSSSYPAPYSVHPSTSKNTPAAQPQRSAAPQQQRSTTPQRSATPQKTTAPQRSSTPQRSAQPQRSAPVRQQPAEKKKPG